MHDENDRYDITTLDRLKKYKSQSFIFFFLFSKINVFVRAVCPLILQFLPKKSGLKPFKSVLLLFWGSLVIDETFRFVI